MNTVDKLFLNNKMYDIEDIYLRTIIDSFDYSNPLSKNSIARGKDITDYFINGSLYNRISDGSFDDLFVGDYFTVNYNGNNINFRIAGFDIFFGHGPINNKLEKHHIVVIPDTSLGSARMNISGTDNTTIGGYVNTQVFNGNIGNVVNTNGLTNINGRLYDIFGEHLLVHYECLTNDVDFDSSANGASVANDWFMVQAVLMSEVEVYGTQVYGSSGYDIGSSTSQLPLFRLMNQYENNSLPLRFSLRDVCNKTSFCYQEYGYPSWLYTYKYPTSTGYTTVNHLIVPRFLIG